MQAINADKTLDSLWNGRLLFFDCQGQGHSEKIPNYWMVGKSGRLQLNKQEHNEPSGQEWGEM